MRKLRNENFSISGGLRSKSQIADPSGLTTKYAIPGLTQTPRTIRPRLEIDPLDSAPGPVRGLERYFLPTHRIENDFEFRCDRDANRGVPCFRKIAEYTQLVRPQQSRLAPILVMRILSPSRVHNRQRREGGRLGAKNLGSERDRAMRMQPLARARDLSSRLPGRPAALQNRRGRGGQAGPESMGGASASSKT